MRSGTNGSRALVPLLLYIGVITAVISSLGAPLLPLIAREYDVGLGEAQWSLTGTVLVGAVSAPIIGRLSDGPRRRTVMLICLSAVVVGSIVVAVTSSFPVLVVGRGLQGLGLGLVAPAMATARERLSEEQAQTAIASLSIIAPAGAGLGYPLSAWIAQAGGLHAAFWFGAFVSALALVLAVFILPSSSTLKSVAPDPIAATSLTLGLLALLVALSEGGQWGWGSGRLLLFLAVAAAGLAVWVTRELRVTRPLVNLHLLRNRSVLAADVSALMLGAAMYTMMSAMTDFIQTPRSVGFGFGASTETAGLLLLPSSFVMLAANRVRIAMSRFVSDRALVPAGAAIVGIASAVFAVTHSALWAAFVTMTLSGVGLGLTFAAMPGLIVRNVPEAETGSALGLYTVVRFVGYSLGSALSAAILDGYTSAGSRNPAERGFVVVWIASAALSAIAAVLTGLVLPSSRKTAGATLVAPTVVVER